MPVSLHHLHFSAPLDALLEVKAFYSQLLDLQEGPRPAFKNPGFWLYAGNHPLIHMSDAGASRRSTDASATTIGHVAFACSDIAAMQAKLVAMQIPFERKTVPALASDPPNVPRDRTAGSPIPPASFASAGKYFAASAEVSHPLRRSRTSGRTGVTT